MGISQTDNQRYKQLSGRYGNNDGICLFEDGTFMLYGYATMVPGKYVFEGELLHFYPDRPELFEVYATQNNSIGNRTRMNFLGFEEGKTYVRFNLDSARSVFNDLANCFSAPYVYEAEKVPGQITLSHVRENEWGETGAETRSSVFEIAKGWNDFILIYNEPKRYYEPFVAIVEKNGDEQLLKLSENFGDRGIVKQVMDADEQKQWQEILAMKAEYALMQTAGQKEIFANRHYKIFYKADPLAYGYDKNTNQYVSKWAKDNEDYYRDNQYNDDRYLHKYSKLAPVKIKTDLPGKAIAAGSIFYSACEGDLPVYKYNGFKEEEKDDVDSETLVTIPGVVPPTAPVNPENNHTAGNIVPFAVDRGDGFYAIVEKEKPNDALPELRLKPFLTKTDISKTGVQVSDMGEPVVQITFTEAGADKLKQLAAANTGKPIAIVVNKKVIAMPVIIAAAMGNPVNIEGGFSLEEARTIADLLRAKNK